MTVIQTCERTGSLLGAGLGSGRLGPGCGERRSPGGGDLPERGTRGRGPKSGEVSSASEATSRASKEAVWISADGWSCVFFLLCQESSSEQGEGDRAGSDVHLALPLASTMLDE